MIENDSLTLPGRVIESSAGIKVIKSLEKAHKLSTSSNWLCVDDFFAMASDGNGFTYEPAGHWNMKSVAADKAQPAPGARAWQMAAGTSEQAEAMAQNIKAEDAGTSAIEVSVKDAGAMQTFKLKLGPDGLKIN